MSRFYINSEIIQGDHYTNDGHDDRFVGWTGTSFILGMQSGPVGSSVPDVRFDETLDVAIYELIGNQAHLRPSLNAVWS